MKPEQLDASTECEVCTVVVDLIKFDLMISNITVQVIIKAVQVLCALIGDVPVYEEVIIAIQQFSLSPLELFFLFKFIQTVFVLKTLDINCKDNQLSHMHLCIMIIILHILTWLLLFKNQKQKKIPTLLWVNSLRGRAHPLDE